MTDTHSGWYRMYLSSIAFLSALAVAGCADTVTSVVLPPPIEPGLGSTYNYHSVIRRSDGNVSETDVNQVVVDTGLSYAGKSNVVKMARYVVDTVAGSIRYEDPVSYSVYEPNGDLTVFAPITRNNIILDTSWVTYTFGSKGEMADSHWEEEPPPRLPSGVQPTGTLTIVIGKGKYIGTEQLALGNEIFETVKIVAQVNVTMYEPEFENSMQPLGESIDTLWYAPRILNLVKRSSTQVSTLGGMTNSVTIQTVLTGYKLQ